MRDAANIIGRTNVENRIKEAKNEPPRFFRRLFYVSQATMAWASCS